MFWDCVLHRKSLIEFENLHTAYISLYDCYGELLARIRYFIYFMELFYLLIGESQ
jgi:hypothetical protein